MMVAEFEGLARDFDVPVLTPTPPSSAGIWGNHAEKGCVGKEELMNTRIDTGVYPTKPQAFDAPRPFHMVMW